MPRVFVNAFGVQGSPLSCQQFCPCFSQFFVPVDNESERTSQKYELLKFGQRKIMVELFFDSNLYSKKLCIISSTCKRAEKIFH